MDDFTLVIPTYDRPRQLAALLGYLEAEGARCRVSVLDSSPPRSRALNRDLIARSRLNIEHAEFPTETRPFDKFRAGIDRVTTPFCALCADDDLIIVEGVSRCLDALRKDPQASVAQGYSFVFTYGPDESITLGNIVYFTPTISDAEPLARVAKLFRQYQAATYGNYRTPVLQRIFSALRPMKEVLASELLGTALAAVEGHMIRVPCLSYGRSSSESESYEHWHPLEWFAKNPRSLFAAYHAYRDVLEDAISRRRDNTHSSEDVRQILDLIHLGYFVQHAPDDAVGFIIEQKIAGTPFSSYWPRPEIHMPLHRAAGVDAPSRSSADNLKKCLELFRFVLRSRQKGPGRHRHNYRQNPGFSKPAHIAPLERNEIERLLDALDNYHLASVPPGGPRDRVSVSVLLCNYNDSRYLPTSLSAICEQTRPPNEVIIVDDGSSDNSLDIIRDFARRYQFIKVLTNQTNRGLLYSIDRALMHASSEFVVWASADDRLLPNFLERNIEYLAQSRNVQMTLSRLATFQDGSDEIYSYTELNHGAAFDFGTSAKYWSPAELRERLKTHYLWLSGNTSVVSRNCLIRAGGFDKNLRWHADYFSFWVVALRHGVCTIPETLAAMRERAQTYSSSGMSQRTDQRATLARLADKLITLGWRDIGLAVFRCPSLLSPFGPLMLEVLLVRPRRWPFAATYGRWLGALYLRGRVRRVQAKWNAVVGQISGAAVHMRGRLGRIKRGLRQSLGR
jgi:glycosyltransferase domain-containing protein